MASKASAIQLNLEECKRLYEDHYKVDLPGDLPYVTAATMVKDEIGYPAFIKRVQELRGLKFPEVVSHDDKRLK